MGPIDPPSVGVRHLWECGKAGKASTGQSEVLHVWVHPLLPFDSDTWASDTKSLFSTTTCAWRHSIQIGSPFMNNNDFFHCKARKTSTDPTGPEETSKTWNCESPHWSNKSWSQTFRTVKLGNLPLTHQHSKKWYRNGCLGAPFWELFFKFLNNHV